MTVIYGPVKYNNDLFIQSFFKRLYDEYKYINMMIGGTMSPCALFKYFPNMHYCKYNTGRSFEWLGPMLILKDKYTTIGLFRNQWTVPASFSIKQLLPGSGN